MRLRGNRRRGSVLITCMAILAVMSLMAVTFAVMMQFQTQASENYENTVHVRQGARIGLMRALNVVRGHIQDELIALEDREDSLTYSAGGQRLFGQVERGWEYLRLPTADDEAIAFKSYNTARSDFLAGEPDADRFLRIAFRLSDLQARLDINDQFNDGADPTPTKTRLQDMLEIALEATDVSLPRNLVQPGRYFTPGQLEMTLHRVDPNVPADFDFSGVSDRVTVYGSPCNMLADTDDPKKYRSLVNINTAPAEVLRAILLTSNEGASGALASMTADTDGDTVFDGEEIVLALIDHRENEGWFTDADQVEDVIAALAPNYDWVAASADPAVNVISEQAANDALNLLLFPPRYQDSDEIVTLVPEPDEGAVTWHDDGAVPFDQGDNPWTPTYIYRYNWDGSGYNQAQTDLAGEPHEAERLEWVRWCSGDVSEDFLAGGVPAVDPPTVEICFRSRVFRIQAAAQVIFFVKNRGAFSQDVVAEARLEAVYDTVARRFLSFRWDLEEATETAADETVNIR